MYKSFIKEMANNDIYGIISLLIFAIVFALVIIYALTMRKDYVGYMKDIPLDHEEEKALETSETLKS